jgi:hypothetical protein
VGVERFREGLKILNTRGKTRTITPSTAAWSYLGEWDSVSGASEDAGNILNEKI